MLHVGLGQIVLILVVLFLIFGAWPGRGFVGHDYGYYPSGFGTILFVLLLLWIFGVL